VGAEATRARSDSQEIGLQLRSIDPLLTERAARCEIAWPSVQIESVFGPRPIEPAARGAWDRAVAVVVSYRHAHSIPADEASLFGPRPSSADARSAWGSAVALADETLKTLQRPREDLERLAVRERDRPRER